ncbi:threonine-phosphate decarboxylase [Parasphingorhabdus cellanae]|uniref:Aminotransferase n=1 Tax=Parasphingorhabdus cellanae TaxID=2806553 RepID=A0ABX7T5A5_9SPHN|nr:threonine-phosphate decarboxylase [Parasphingorhabdus cellanae]QTD56768.1 pyridoxal phosphate-dependent class II aminotransferase [Parasphingorhabdus cellanae]
MKRYSAMARRADLPLPASGYATNMSNSPATNPFRFHGGRLAAAAVQFADAPAPWVDLSTGISPWAYPLPELAPDIWSRLPEPELIADLELAAAKAFGVSNPAEIIAVPGSDMAIRMLGSLFADQRGAMLTPIYSGHKAAWPEVEEISIEEAADKELVILANPNNPDGRIVAPEKLRALHGQVIVDEAFADTAPSASILPERGNAIVLRSFGKFYGLAGIRLGFVIANIAIVEKLRRMLGDWPISGVAATVGLAAYADRDWQDQQRQRLQTAAARLDNLLKDSNLHIVGGTSLFRLVSHHKAQKLFHILGQAGLLVRPFYGDEEQLRFGLPASEEEWQRLENALKIWRDKQ